MTDLAYHLKVPRAPGSVIPDLKHRKNWSKPKAWDTVRASATGEAHRNVVSLENVFLTK